MSLTADVVIIGGGITGTSTASTLVAMRGIAGRGIRRRMR
jgi:L-2-hydroxyglutarate oxidase LhgO